jgi:endonuclease YncB( thermonuclease family)
MKKIIDTLERRQDFGKRAKQFTSVLVFGKQVRIVKEEMDRYGRIVGTVHVGNVCVNEEIIKAGFACVYRKYCKSAVCAHWLRLEETARLNRIGLWGHKNPIEP